MPGPEPRGLQVEAVELYGLGVPRDLAPILAGSGDSYLVWDPALQGPVHDLAADRLGDGLVALMNPEFAPGAPGTAGEDPSRLREWCVKATIVGRMAAALGLQLTARESNSGQ